MTTYKCQASYSNSCIVESTAQEAFRGRLCFYCYQEKMRQYHRTYYKEKRRKVKPSIVPDPSDNSETDG